MVGYEQVESAIVSLMVSHFDELSTARCLAGDLDNVYDAIFEENSKYGAYLEFNGGGKRKREPFKSPIWVWSIAGILIIRKTDEVENNLRMILDKLKDLFANDHTLGGIVPFAEIIDIGRPVMISVADAPFYWLPFVIDVFDK